MNEPKVIYLNIGFDKDEIDIKDEDFEKLIGISWSDTRINDQDLRYELSERQTPTEANNNPDTKQLNIADVSKQKDELFIRCECGAEGLLINHIDYSKIYNNITFDNNEFEIAIFRSYNYRNNLWQRIKYAVWHLWTGQKHKDQMCFNYEKAKEIINFMNMCMKTKTSKSSNN